MNERVNGAIKMVVHSGSLLQRRSSTVVYYILLRRFITNRFMAHPSFAFPRDP